MAHMTQLEAIRFTKECYPEYRGQLYMNLKDTANLFGLSPRKMREFIIADGIPFYRPVGEKLYCILEVFEAFKKTRYREVQS